MHSDVKKALASFGIGDKPLAVGIGAKWSAGTGPTIVARSPIDGRTLVEFPAASAAQVDDAIAAATRDFPAWRDKPAPVRGELVRRFGEALRKQIDDLATIVAWEAGKIMPEARGEV